MPKVRSPRWILRGLDREALRGKLIPHVRLGGHPPDNQAGATAVAQRQAWSTSCERSAARKGTMSAARGSSRGKEVIN